MCLRLHVTVFFPYYGIAQGRCAQRFKGPLYSNKIQLFRLLLRACLATVSVRIAPHSHTLP
jgi:hypothetical protein